MYKAYYNQNRKKCKKFQPSILYHVGTIPGISRYSFCGLLATAFLRKVTTQSISGIESDSRMGIYGHQAAASHWALPFWPCDIHFL